MTSEAIERRPIIISIVASSFFGVLGIAISLASQSGAVFLDGIFSLIFGVVGFLTFYVSSLVTRPRDESYPFGYATFEPMLNLFKGLLIAFVLIYAVWEAVRTILVGGRDIAAGGGIVYAAIATIGGVVVIVFLRRYARTSGSPIVEVDARNWTVDTLISSAVGFAFVVTLLIQNSQWSDLAPYADPVMMLAIAAIAVPQPLQTIRQNWGQLVGKAPPRSVQSKVADLVATALTDVEHDELHLRVVEVGRYIHVHIYIVVNPEAKMPIDIKRHDAIRYRIYAALSQEYRYLAIDVGFTLERRWALNSVTSESVETVMIPNQPLSEPSK